MTSACRARINALSPGKIPGFSLIELMVVLAVAGILFFVALPGYQYAVIKSGRVAAKSALMEVMARQEQFFVNNKRYALNLGELGLPETYFVNTQGEVAEQEAAVYRLVLVLVEDTYTGASAFPVNRQAQDSACMVFTLSRLGVRAVNGALAAAPGDCW